MPYTKVIGKNAEGSHQASPAYVLTFVRWQNRDTINYDLPDLGVRNPFVVINDAISVQTTDSKSSVTGSVNIILKAGDINYATTMAPGDFVFVNLLNDEFTAKELAKIAGAGGQINKYEHGFKGLYKIQKVRRQISVDPASGAKSYQFVIHAFSFTELKTIIYYNPTAAKAFKESRQLFLSQFADWWSDVSTSRSNQNNNMQPILVRLTKALLGAGLRNRSDLATDATANDQFFMPSMVGNLMGINKQRTLTVSDVYHFIFGIWKNEKPSEAQRSSNPGHTTPGVGFNPGIKQIGNNQTFFQTASGALQGWRLLAAEDFNYKEIWSIIKSYMNAGINEAYTCMRISPTNGGVYPTVVIRQKPFNSRHFAKPNKVNGKKSGKTNRILHTRYDSLPRWRIDPDLIYSIDLGKDEVARVNYLQFYGRSISTNPGYNEALQAQNIFYDKEDIKRHGLKPQIVTTNMDFPLNRGNTSSEAKKWAWLMFDMLNAGQNRESGVISCQGILEPISVGDNLQFDGSIYHIEAVSHVMQVAPDGKKSFKTNLTLSFGTSLESNTLIPVYPQQKNTYSEVERKDDYNRERILPGLGEAQFLPQQEGKSRSKGELVRTTEERQKAQVPFTGPPNGKTGRGRASTVRTNFDDGTTTKNVNTPDPMSKPKKDKS